MKLWRIFLLSNTFSFIFFFVYGQSPPVAQAPQYQFRKFLDDDRAFELLWSLTETGIQFEVNVRTTGYIGFGLSRTGKMSPADMVIGWVQDNFIYFGDYHTVGDESRTPIYDPSQDWILRARPGLQYAKEENGYTTIAFERNFDTCDENDTVITGDTMRVIYSYHDSDPNVTTGIFPHHGYERRGTKYIYFKEQPPVPELFPPEGSYRLPLQIQNYEIPNKLYTRQCLVLNLTESVVPNSYLIMYEPIIQPGNEAYLYHMMLYRCNIEQQALINNRFDCTDGGPPAIKACTKLIASWSMGGEPFYFPEGTGIFNGPDDPYTYVLQVHYTNGLNASGVVDSSGLNLIFSTTPRQTEVAFLSLGSVISSNLRQVIPPGEANFKTSTYCSKRCFQWGTKDRTPRIQAIGVIFHGNDIAKEMKLRLFRDNVELPWISADKQYDSFFQSVRLFDQPVTIENSTDIISLECTYNSTIRTSLTKGGWSQVEELCRATLIYYPPLAMDQCLSWSSLDQLVTATGQNMPENMTMRYLDYIDPWDLDATNRLKTALDLSTQKGLCSSQQQTPSYALDQFPNPSGQDRLEYQEPGSPCPGGTM